MQKSEQLDKLMSQARAFAYSKIGNPQQRSSLTDDNLLSTTKVVVPPSSSHLEPKVRLEEPQLITATTSTQVLPVQVKPRLEEPPKVTITKEQTEYLIQPPSATEGQALPLSARIFLKQNRASLTAFEYDEVQTLDTVYFYPADIQQDGESLDDPEGYLNTELGDHILYRFEIKSILGKGSFAQVVCAHDHKLGTDVAIKINRNTEIDHQFAAAEAKLLQ